LPLHEKDYPYNHDKTHIRRRFLDFKTADVDLIGLFKGKTLEIIKLDIIDFADKIIVEILCYHSERSEKVKRVVVTYYSPIWKTGYPELYCRMR